MRSSWVWMMVLVALGSAQKPPQQMPDFNIQKLKGLWYPLATAHEDGNLRGPFEYRINPKNKKSFEIIFPIGKSGVCEKKTAIATPFEEGFKIDSKLIAERMLFLDTDYTNYHIVYIVYGRQFALYLYGRSRDLTEQMKTRFTRMVGYLRINPKNVNYNPKIECSF